MSQHSWHKEHNRRCPLHPWSAELFRYNRIVMVCGGISTQHARLVGLCRLPASMPGLRSVPDLRTVMPTPIGFYNKHLDKSTFTGA